MEKFRNVNSHLDIKAKTPRSDSVASEFRNISNAVTLEKLNELKEIIESQDMLQGEYFISVDVKKIKSNQNSYSDEELEEVMVDAVSDDKAVSKLEADSAVKEIV